MKVLNFLIGFFIGAIVIWLAISVKRGEFKFPSERVVARVGEASLSEALLEQRLAVDLIPIENDRYRLMYDAAQKWIEDTVLEKEAAEKNLSMPELVAKEVWARVQVSSLDVQDYYNKNKHIYNQPFEVVSAILFKDLRLRKFESAKTDYVSDLQKKFNAAISLQAPEVLIPAWEPLPPSTIPSQMTDQSKTETANTQPPAPAGKAPPFPTDGSAPSLGPSNAKITIQEFADFECYFCKKAADTIKQVLKKYPNDVRLVFRHFPLSTQPGQESYLIHEGSACAHAQGKFWEYHDAAFAFPGKLDQAEIDRIASNIKLDTVQFGDCLKSGKFRTVIDRDRQAGKDSGVSGTPAFFINDQIIKGAYPLDRFSAVIEGILDPSKKVVIPPPQTPPVKKIYQFNDLEGRPSRGPENAPVTIVEFSDFHCSFCEKVKLSMDQIVENYKDKVRIVWRHFPLAIHPGAEHTHEASECAAEQGKFWEYHDKLFSPEAGNRSDEILLKLAGSVGINGKKFKKCLESGKYSEVIKKDIQKGDEAGVNGTPAFFINGKLHFGALPYSAFEALIKSELDKSNQPKP